MKTYCLCIRFFALLYFSTALAHAIPLASAKVLVSEGVAIYGDFGAEETPLTVGTILSAGDSIVTGELGVVHLIFSNGVGLTIAENTNLVFSKLEQRPYWRSNPDELPKEEISRSNFVLELKYGSIKGHVKGLRKDSEFRIKTLLGDVLASENLFFTELFYDSFRKKLVLTAQNVNGSLDLITKFSGPLKFGRKSNIDKSYNPSSPVFQKVRIPTKKSISVKGSRFIREFRSLVRLFPKGVKSKLVDEFETIEPFITSQESTVASPNNKGDVAESDIIVEEEPNIAVEEITPDIILETVPETVVEETESDI